MRERQEEKRIGRRDLFKTAGLGALAGAAVVATGQKEAEAATDSATQKGDYRETDHVKTYYTLAKF